METWQGGRVEGGRKVEMDRKSSCRGHSDRGRVCLGFLLLAQWLQHIGNVPSSLWREVRAPKGKRENGHPLPQQLPSPCIHRFSLLPLSLLVLCCWDRTPQTGSIRNHTFIWPTVPEARTPRIECPCFKVNQGLQDRELWLNLSVH